MSNPLDALCLVVVLLRYPESRLTRSYERWVTVIAFIWVIGCLLIVNVTWPPLWLNHTQYDYWPWWFPNYELHSTAVTALDSGTAALSAVFGVLLIMRVKRTRGLDRRTYVPIHIASILAVLIAGVNIVAVLQGHGVGPYLRGWPYFHYVQWLLLAIPILLLLAGFQRRLLRLRISSLIAQVNSAPTPIDVQAAMRRTFSDPRLTLQFWSGTDSEFKNVDGTSARSGASSDQMIVDLPYRDGSHLARVFMDSSAAHHNELLTATKAASGLALEIAALQVSLATSLDEVREARQEGESMSRFLPTGLVEKLRRDGARIGATEQLEVTVLMSDVRGYSAIAEKTDPSALAAQLNTHRREMNRVVMDDSGTVMQYVGDAVMAVFGAPVPLAQHADHALTAALNMHLAQQRINESWATAGLPTFGLGIGLSTGPVAAALLGSEQRLEYTLVGDTVNLAQRLQDLARPAGSTVLSDATWRQLTARPHQHERLPAQRVKGRSTAVECIRIATAQSQSFNHTYN